MLYRAFAWLAGLLLILTALCMLRDAQNLADNPPRLLLAPMLEVTDTCILADFASNQTDGLQQACEEGEEASAAQLVNQTLAPLMAGAAPHPHYEVGYTLAIPLLRLYEQTADGAWQLNQQAVDRYARTLRDAQHDAIIYLFSTHFSVQSPLEEALAMDAQNLGQTQQGSLPTSSYFGMPLYGWSVARTDNPLTHYRRQAMQAIGERICRQGDAASDKVRGITLLGEVHQLFPDFEAGTGYTEPYLITDYSEASKAQFRHWLQQRYGSLRNANRNLHTAYSDWADIQPPAENLYQMPEQWATRLHAHMDAYAHGVIPFSGWVYVPDEAQHHSSRIVIYQDGKFLARVPIAYGRPDVLEALPELGERVVGWQYALDYRQLASGLHRFDVYLQTSASAPLQHLARKELNVQTLRPGDLGVGAVPPAVQSQPVSPDVRFYVDLPFTDRLYIYNPLARDWHAFRQAQVLRYLQSFADVFEGTCLAETPMYMHQYMPHLNPGRDVQKFAIDRTLEPQKQLGLSLSLYGESGMSEALVQNLKVAGHKTYGVAEFHPLKPLDAQAFGQALHMHQRNGAAFFSFFLEPVWSGHELERATPNPFALSPHNPFKGSDVSYGGLRAVLSEPPAQ